MNTTLSSSSERSHSAPKLSQPVEPMPSPRSFDQGGSDSSSTETQGSSTRPSRSSRCRQIQPNHPSRIKNNSGQPPQASIRTCINQSLTGIECFFPILLFTVKSNQSIMDELTNSLSVALNLTETECTIQTLREPTPINTPESEIQSLPLYLVVKVHTVKSFNRKNFMEKMTIDWNNISRNPVVITDRSNGLFLVEFGCYGDRQLAVLVSSSLGHLLEVYRPSFRETWGPYFRIRVMFDVAQPLPSGVPVHFTGINKVVWLELKYENLPDICFFCGRMGHSYNKGCMDYMKACDEAPFPSELRYDIKTITGKVKVTTNALLCPEQLNFANPPVASFMTTNPASAVCVAPPEIMPPFPTYGTLTNAPSGPKPNKPCHRAGLPATMNIISWNARGIGSDRAFRNLSRLVSSYNPTMLFIMEYRLAKNAIGHVKNKLHFDSGLEMPRIARGNPDRGPSSAFRQLLDSFNLSPLTPEGPLLTWNNNVAHPKNIQERIDWGIINDSWMDTFPEASLTHLGFFGSDHRALKLVRSNPPGPQSKDHSKRFHFENVWLKDPNWTRIFDQSWTSPTTTQEAIPKLVAAQSSCAHTLNNWNHKKDFNFKQHISKLEKELESARSASIWDDHTITTIKDLQSRLDALLYKEETYWKQRAKTQWLAQGDKNTKFFHRFASHRKKINKIHQLHLPNGGIVYDEEGIIREIESHFDHLFTSSNPSNEDMNKALEGITRSLSDLDKTLLAEDFSSDEIEKAFTQLPLDKAPGLDGFNSHFYKAN
uniref:Zinc knuckle CX2CX4HX4C domain-containing protein n=1 Tax=Cannabis sativa TaxID=3483 RepID=A0A803PJL3_CANSA